MRDASPPDPAALAALPPDRLFRHADLSGLAFTTTRELAPAPVLVGQGRAEEAIRLGAGLVARGFNIFATGQTKTRISSSLHKMLETVRPPGKPPQDWVYVNNFVVTHRPTAICLPAGRAMPLQQAMRKMIEDLRVTLPALFESDDYQRRRTEPPCERLLILPRRATMNEEMPHQIAGQRKVPVLVVTAEEDQPAGLA